MSNGKRDLLWTPQGVKDLTKSATVERVELQPKLLEWLAQFDAFAQHFRLGLHCSKCGADLVGKNAETDKVFSASCNCRDFVGTNRDYREPTAAEAFYGNYGKVN